MEDDLLMGPTPLEIASENDSLEFNLEPKIFFIESSSRRGRVTTYLDRDIDNCINIVTL